MQSVVLLTTGVPGSGKTYVRCARFLVDDFLPNSNAVHYSNFPVKRYDIALEIGRQNKLKRGILYRLGIRRKLFCPLMVLIRVRLISDTVLQSWHDQQSGPWDFFSGVDLKYCHIAIDEIHNFCSPSKSEAYLQKWDEFLGEVRHRGCTFEALTQDVSQVSKIITGRAAVRLDIVPCETLRDPYFKILYLDWYNLRASFTGDFTKSVFEIEKLKGTASTVTAWKENNRRCFRIEKSYYKFYNSYNASLQELKTGEVQDSNRAPDPEYKRRSRLSLFWWFYSRNWWTITSRVILSLLVIWLCFFGGFSFLLLQFTSLLQLPAKSNGLSVRHTKTVSGKSGSRTTVGQKRTKTGDADRSDQAESVRIEAKDIEALQRKLMELEKKNVELQKKLQDETAERLRPVMICKDYFVLKHGARYYVGDKLERKIDEKERTVKSIDPLRRLYVVSDGVVFRMQ